MLYAGEKELMIYPTGGFDFIWGYGVDRTILNVSGAQGDYLLCNSSNDYFMLGATGGLNTQWIQQNYIHQCVGDLQYIGAPGNFVTIQYIEGLVTADQLIASTTPPYTGPNFVEWLFVAGVILFFLSFMAWGKIYRPAKQLYDR